MLLPTGGSFALQQGGGYSLRVPVHFGQTARGAPPEINIQQHRWHPLITPALSGRLHLQARRSSALELLRNWKDRVGYVGDEVCEEDRPNPDLVPNQWSRPGFHYECHHAECVVTGTVQLYFITEEEYLAHWNAFHAAVFPWYICPTAMCRFIVPGEPNAIDCYMMHVQRCHVNHGETGGLERESSKTTQDSTRWGVNPCFRDVGLKDRHPPPRRIPVEDPGELPVIGA